ncbi:MAG: DUF4838 domain-containing protein [Clostridia bacterium]|nr:DUF4838 domain-containing protein [Clostridia bacterium]
MKKLLCVLVGIIMIVSSISFSSFASESGFDVSQAVIVAGESVTDKYAASRLEYYLEQITGRDIAVVSDSQPEAELEIVVGTTERETVNLDGFEDGGYVITSDEEKIIICGAGNKGTINGVYAFLEDYCGCHWYESGVIVTPENASLTVPYGIDDEYHPFFEYTETDTTSSRDIEFSLANGLTGGVYRSFTAEQGGQVGYIGSFAHTLVTHYCKPETYFEAHPEYYAYHKGERVPQQLCLTNPDVIDVVVGEVLENLSRQHDPSATIQIVSLTQHDNQKYCECDKCKALDDANGSHAGTMITFVNTVAERVKASGNYDNVVFDTFAYQYTRKAPTAVVPREDVIVRLCSIECCFGHTLDDPKCDENKEFMYDLEQWGKICNRVYIWDYVNNYRETVCIFPNFGVMQRNVQIFYENNVKGIYEEGNYYISECDAEFGEMRTYLLSKLMQDPYCDYSAEMNGYLKAVYGPGWQNIREFIDIMTEHAVTDSKHLYIYQKSQETLYGMTNEDIEYCNQLWKNAKAETQTEEQLSQLIRSELCWRYWKCANRKGEFSLWQFPYVWMNSNERLHHDMKDMGILKLGEGGQHALSDCNLLYLFRQPFKWTTLYEESYWDFLNPYAVKLYDFLGIVYNALFK